mmetsp:Transcript_55532/g.111366  ORF Transcript_55532/g.111366 Transcript_55532/m.111366 type:complete len:315 (+) Transcript_55532:102-1046(+)
MKSRRGNKRPVPIVAPPLKSLKKARKVTSEFHRITHAINQLEKDEKISQKGKHGLHGDEGKLCSLRAELTALGGREVYQQASVVTTARCSSSKWVVKCLRRRAILGSNKDAKPRVLEVGAINTELLENRDLEVRAIDILSRHPKIEELDFFELAAQELKGSRTPNFDTIVASMVINCVPTPLDRGRMLCLLKQLLTPHGGLLFLTLPLSCLTCPGDAPSGRKARAAPGFNKAAFEALLTNPTDGLGFIMHGTPDSKATEKVVFYCLERRDVEAPAGANAATARNVAYSESPKVDSSQASVFSVVLPRTEAGKGH